MSEHQPAADPTASIAEEYAATPYEPLLPIEKKLIATSLILGVALLVLLSWASTTFFPATTPPPAAKPAASPPPAK